MSSGNVAAASRIPTGMKYVTAYYISPSVTLAKRWGGLIVRHQLHFKRLHPPFKRIQWKFNRATFYTRASSSPSSLPEILSLLLLSKENYLVELSLCTPAGCLTHPNLYPPFGEGKKKKKRKSRLQADKHLSNGVAVKAVTGDGVDVNPADREPGSPLGPVAEEKKKEREKEKKKERAAGNPVPLNFLLSHFHCRRPLDTPFVSFIFSSSYSFFSLSFSSFEQSTIFCIPVEIFILSFIYLGCTS